MDEKPKCSQDVEPITQQPTKKKEEIESEDQKELLVLSKEHSLSVKTLLMKDQRASEEHSDAAKILTVLSIDQPIYSSEQPAFATDQAVYLPKQFILSTDQPIYSPEQPICLPDQLMYATEQPTFSTEQLVVSIDQSSHSIDQPINLRDQPIFSKKQPPSNDQTPYLNTQSVLTIDQPIVSAHKPIHFTEPDFFKEQPICSEDQSSVPKKQTVLTKNQSIFSTDQYIFSKEKPGYSKDQSDCLNSQTVLTIDQSVYSPDQPVYSPDQPVYSPDQPVYSPDQPVYLPDQSIYSIDQLVKQIGLANIPVESYSEDQSAFPNSHTILTADYPISSTNQAAFSKEQPAAYSKDASSPEEQTGLSTIHTEPTIPKSSSSRELLIAARIIEAASTKYVSVFPKNEVAKRIGNSINVEYGISLCAAREATATSSYNLMNNGYFLSANAPVKIHTSTQSSSLPDSMSLMPAPASVAVAVGTQPASLFLLALSKLNEGSLTLAVISHFRLRSPSNLSRSYTFLSGDITPPDSLTSAPPTYSFVLRQIAGRRRPRFMGSFFPSPSFVQHTPPPTYNGAFDIYVEPPLPPPATRTYSLGYNSMPVICPECGYTGMTVIRAHVTVCTHCCAFVLCVLCCWICAPLPYVLTSCKDVYHYCRNCRSFLGMYCPNNPDATSMFPTDLNR